MWGYVIAAIILAIASYAGQRETNRENRKLANDQWERELAAQNTAYQRSVNDMRAAGLNPISGVSMGGAGTPSVDPAKMENAVGKGINSGMQAAQMKADLELIKEQTQTVKSQGIQAEANATKAAYEGVLAQALTETTQSQAKVNNASAKQIELTLPGLANRAAVETGNSGKAAAWLQRWRESVFGGGPAVAPLGR